MPDNISTLTPNNIILKLFNYFPQKIFYKDKDFNYVFCNENYASDLGISTSEIQGKTDFDFYPKGVAEEYRHTDVMVLNSGVAQDIQEEREIDGKKHWIRLIKTLVKEEGQNVGILGMYWDITKQKQIEQDLRESEEKFRGLSEASFEGIVVHENGKIIEVNQVYEKMFGYKLAEIIGKYVLDIALTPESSAVVKELIRLGSEKPYEAVGVRKDGTTFQMEVHAKQIIYHGRPARVAAIRDITERKKIEDTLKENLDIVERMNKLMVGRELKMIELKEKIRRLESGQIPETKNKQELSWKQKFKEGEEIEEIFITKINGPYTRQIDLSQLPGHVKEECKKLLQVLVNDSIRHLASFREMEAEENGQ